MHAQSYKKCPERVLCVPEVLSLLRWYKQGLWFCRHQSTKSWVTSLDSLLSSSVMKQTIAESSENFCKMQLTELYMKSAV